jgi:hypothetical protein
MDNGHNPETGNETLIAWANEEFLKFLGKIPQEHHDNFIAITKSLTRKPGFMEVMEKAPDEKRKKFLIREYLREIFRYELKK